MRLLFKPLLVCFALVAILANCQSAYGQLVTYELGPFHVTGLGATPEEAEAEAYGAMYDMLLEIEENLPEGHVLLDFVIDYEDLTSIDTYEIDFHVIVWIPTPPPPPGGT